VSSLLQKNKPEPYAASPDFINAILWAERPILSNKNNTERQAAPTHRLIPGARHVATMPEILIAPDARSSLSIHHHQ
jgi:hypothetical protein